MIEYRLSPEDDELDDLEEGAELSLDDDLGDYGLDDDDDEELAVPAFAQRVSPTATVESAVIEVVEVPAAGATEAPPARKPVKKAAAPAKKAAAPVKKAAAPAKKA